MKRPSFQFYPADWRNNAKLRRCSEAARGAWMDVLCVLHDADEYGVCRWPMTDLARAAGVSLKLLRELASKDVLKGADGTHSAYIYIPRHAGRNGDPVELVAAGNGPCWYSSRMVRDEWVRQRRGGESRFGATDAPPKANPKATPKVSPKPPIGEPVGYGSTSSSSSSSTSLPTVENKESAPRAPPARKRAGHAVDRPSAVSPEVLTAAGFDATTAAEFIAHKQAVKAPLTERAWADHCREAEMAGWTPQKAAEKVMAKNWKGFEAKYVAAETTERRVPASHSRHVGFDKLDFNEGITADGRIA